MCLSIAFRGDDLLYGFNMDLDPSVWQYSIHKTKDLFAIGITVGKTTYYVHGINKNGNFGNVPYMNGERFPVPRGARRERIDLMNDRYVRGRYSFADIEEILRTKSLCCIPAATMHSLIGSGQGEMLIVEPGYGARKVEDNYAVLSNFPLFADLTVFDDPYYGKDRYDHAKAVLSAAGPDFCVQDALQLLYETRQDGKWGTRVSFVWSRNENAVYYYPEGEIGKTEKHLFREK